MDRYIILGIIIFLILLLIVHVTNGSNAVTEKFADTEIPNLQACPASLNKYTTDKAINCCKGTVIGGKCDGEPKCTLSNASNELPRCIDWYAAYLKEMGQKHCPKTLSNYFENKNNQGICTSSALTRDLKAPLVTTAPQCEVYKTIHENERQPRSCYNLRRLDAMAAPKGAFKSIQTYDKSGKNPVILYATYMDELKSMACYERNSLYEYFDAVFGSNWRSNAPFQQYIKVNLKFCDDEKKRLDTRASNPLYKSPLEQMGLQPKTR